MADAFDLLGDATTTDKGSIYDYNASAGEAFGAGAQRQWDTNPAALLGRGIRIFNEDMASLAGINDRIDQKTAEEEVRSRGLDLKIPMGGITRYELDTLQYLKQREIRQNTVSARTRGVVGMAAGFAGGLAASLPDPINLASNFIPFVSEFRYAKWLAQAGESTLARAAVRIGAGAIEGAAGAAVVEPLVYEGATSQQLDYSLTDSFLNVTLGGVMGGGLHAIGGAVHDARVSRALRGLDTGIQGNEALRVQAELRDAAAAMPEHVQREVLQTAVRALEVGDAVDVTPQVVQHMAEGGEPIKAGDVWYHGTPHDVYGADGSGQFRLGDGESSDVPVLWGVDDAFVAEGYSRGEMSLEYDDAAGRFPLTKPYFKEHTGAGGVYGLRSKAQNPLEYDAEGKSWVNVPQNRILKDAKAAGHDAVIFRNIADEMWPGSKKTSSVIAWLDPKAFEADAKRPPKQSTPRDLGGLIEQAKADRTEAAFNRQFGDEADGRAPPAKPEPKGLIERAKADFDTANDIVDEFRKEGRLTAEDEAALKQIDEAVKAAELKAKATEAAAACMVVA